MQPKYINTDEFTLESGWLNTDDGHQVWYESWGNKDAKIPIFIFHGGPGGRFKDKHKYNFDPEIHHVIGFDQRGCGNSLPYGSIKNNTTADLISDAKNILDKLGVGRVHIFGGSWGSTLGLLFAMEHPDMIEDIILRGIYLGTRTEIDWLDRGDFKNFYPEVWERFKDSVPKEHRADPASYHYEVLSGEDESEINHSAKALDDLESPTIGFDWQGYDKKIKKDTDPNSALIEYDAVPYKIFGHYFKNECFLAANYIIENAGKIKAPLYMVQGRYDMACPPITAYNLHKAVPGSKLFITLGSHSLDPENRTALKVLTETLY